MYFVTLLLYFVKSDCIFFPVFFKLIFELAFYQFHASRVPVVRLEPANFGNAVV